MVGNFKRHFQRLFEVIAIAKVPLHASLILSLRLKIHRYLFFQINCPPRLFSSRCPFLLNLDLIGIANRFAQFNLPAFALGTLLLIPSAQKKDQQIHVSVSMRMQDVKKKQGFYFFFTSLFSTFSFPPFMSHLKMIRLKPVRTVASALAVLYVFFLLSFLSF